VSERPLSAWRACARALIVTALASVVAPAPALDLARYALVDLTHPLNADAIYWPTQPSGFEKRTLAFGETDAGYFYSAFSFCAPEHVGTHLDAPLHFAAQGQATDEIPLDRLIAPGVVIDVTRQAAADRNYRLTPADLLAFEAAHGPIAPGTAVLLYTGWQRFWPDRKAYLGDDTPGDASRLEFPSFGTEAARILIDERKVALIGVDTASIDYGKSTTFEVHRIAGAADVPGLENLKALERLPPAGFVVVALPPKIEGGSGGPVRVVALVPR
jgi:kynurenine formamidase